MEMNKVYESAVCEKTAQQLWEQEKIYNYTHQLDKQTVSIDTPPPTVSGSLHIGHVFSYTHQDLIARYKRMRGFNVFYPMGFDDNGLPTERFVEKKLGLKAHNLKRSEFISLCLKETSLVEKDFEKLWRSLGLSIDWSKVYSTISDKARKTSQYSFIDLYKKGFVYRKQEPSLYCTTCRTSVAQAELDGIDVSSQFNDITFSIDNQPFTIATTRPELLPACVALFFHPTDERYQKLIGKSAIVPIFGHTVPVLADDKVDKTKGTGLVMCCTFGDQTDIFWYKKHRLSFIQAVGLDGKWTTTTGPLAGLAVHEARKNVLELLKAANLLVGQKPITHAVNTHERCKQEIEFQILSQWFIKILDYKEDFLQRGEEISWYPDFMKARYRDWVTHLNWDWCISRQRFFGIPFPVWHCQQCAHIIIAEREQLPIDPQEQQSCCSTCPQCGSGNIVPDTDVMDTWNTSALTPQINTNWPDASPEGLSLPMSIRPQAHDIIRTWAFDTIVKAHFHHNTIPWKDIVISGHVLAGKEKISKSKENSKMSPETLLETYPADVIRYWAASARLGTDTAFSENQLKIGQRLITKLWNALRFCSQHLEDYQQRDQQPQLNAINQWVLHHFAVAVKEYIELYDKYEYYNALERAEQFFWGIFCDNYLELIKDQFFAPEKYSPDDIAATRYTLYHIGFGILQLFAPFLPHATETLYQLLFKKNEKKVSLHVTNFDHFDYTFTFIDGVELGNKIIELVGTIRKLKSASQVSLKTNIHTLIVYSENKKTLDGFFAHENLLIGITKAATINYSQQSLLESSMTEEDGSLVARVKI
jgi:valyl-tRNA synthetase